jgi:hypothetical protein
MNPEAVSELLELLPGNNAILDPFVGSGTTMIEVLLAGRAAVGYDLSPLAVGIAKYHSWRPSPGMIDELRSAVVEVVASFKGAGGESAGEECSSSCENDNSANDGDSTAVHAAATPSSEPEIDSTFTIDRRMALGSRLSWEQVHQVVSVQAQRASVEVAGALWFLLSHEELYEWPDWRRPRSLEWRFTRNARRYIEQVLALVHDIPAGTAEADIYVANATDDQRRRRSTQGTGGVRDAAGKAVPIDGVLTSPPYPGVYNYVHDDGKGKAARGRGVYADADATCEAGGTDCDAGRQSTGLTAWVMAQAEEEDRRQEKQEQENGEMQEGQEGQEGREGREGREGVNGQEGQEGQRREEREIGSRQQLRTFDESTPGAFAQRWQDDTEAWLLACGSQLEPGGRIVMLIGDNADIDALQVRWIYCH